MSDYIANSALAGCVVAAVFGSIGVRSVPHLEGKLAQFRRGVVAQAVCLGLFATGLVFERGAGPSASHPGAASDLAAMHELGRETVRWNTMRLVGLVVALLANLPSLLHLLRELQSFVLHHRTDLLARDQAAAGGGKG